MKRTAWRIGFYLLLLSVLGLVAAHWRIEHYESLEGSIMRLGGGSADQWYRVFVAVRVWSAAGLGLSWLIMASIAARTATRIDAKLEEVKTLVKPTLPLVRYCPKCSKVVKLGQRFCSRCGLAL